MFRNGLASGCWWQIFPAALLATGVTSFKEESRPTDFCEHGEGGRTGSLAPGDVTSLMFVAPNGGKGAVNASNGAVRLTSESRRYNRVDRPTDR